LKATQSYKRPSVGGLLASSPPHRHPSPPCRALPSCPPSPPKTLQNPTLPWLRSMETFALLRVSNSKRQHLEPLFTNIYSATIYPWVCSICPVRGRREHICSRIHKHLSVLPPNNRTSSRYPCHRLHRRQLGSLRRREREDFPFKRRHGAIQQVDGVSTREADPSISKAVRPPIKSHATTITRWHSRPRPIVVPCAVMGWLFNV
jgi:hypothetical protein